MQLCFVGDRNDLSAAYVAWRAEQRGARCLWLPEDTIGIEWTCAAGSRNEIILADRTLSTSDLDGVFVRLNPDPPVSTELGLLTEGIPLYITERRCGLQHFLNRLLCPVVNKPSAGRSNSSKPYQMLMLSALGFRVPRWIVSNDVEHTRSFIQSCPSGAIYKACSGLRAQVRRAEDDLLDRLRTGAAPVLLQEFIPGVDVRVHVVGTRGFATQIKSNAVDYRFEGSTQYAKTDVPQTLLDLCVNATKRDGLLLSGLDFRLDETGTWWCLEMNPVPTFLPYEAGSGHPIADTILELFGRLDVAAPHTSPLLNLAD